jgi:hypothetical protein
MKTGYSRFGRQRAWINAVMEILEKQICQK